MRLGECKQAVMRGDPNNGIIIHAQYETHHEIDWELRVPQIKISGGVMNLDSSVCNYLYIVEPCILILP